MNGEHKTGQASELSLRMRLRLRLLLQCTLFHLQDGT